MQSTRRATGHGSQSPSRYDANRWRGQVCRYAGYRSHYTPDGTAWEDLQDPEPGDSCSYSDFVPDSEGRYFLSGFLSGSDYFGCLVERVLESGLREREFSPSSPDNWRDCGWSMDVDVGEATLQIAIAATAEPRLWILQVASLAAEPGLIGRLFGSRTVDRSAEVYAVAVAVHQVLQANGFSDIRWCLDGYPDDAESRPEPPAPRQ